MEISLQENIRLGSYPWCFLDWMKNRATICPNVGQRRTGLDGQLMRLGLFDICNLLMITSMYACICTWYLKFLFSHGHVYSACLEAYALYGLLSFARRYWRKSTERGTKGEACVVCTSVFLSVPACLVYTF